MQRVEELAGLMTRSGMNTVALQDARGAQWTKLIFNASTNPVGALTLLHHGAATRFTPTGKLFEDLIGEGEAVANALGIELHGDPRQMVQKGANAPGKHRASMLQDVLAKRQTEVDFMNGAIVKWANRPVCLPSQSSPPGNSSKGWNTPGRPRLNFLFAINRESIVQP
jgi:2-dehydropantoate 2-reductase